jgi:hypothetical protein
MLESNGNGGTMALEGGKDHLLPDGVTVVLQCCCSGVRVVLEGGESGVRGKQTSAYPRELLLKLLCVSYWIVLQPDIHSV